MSELRNYRPLIGITPGYAGPNDNRDFVRKSDMVFTDLNYVRRVERAGGLPLLLPHVHFHRHEQIEQMAAICDGLLLTGGDDVHPKYYNQEWYNAGVPIAAERDEFEMPLTELFLSTGKPILAICRGIQLINVIMGGTLVQDIPHFIGSTHHSQTDPTGVPTHQVQVEENCRLARIFNGDIIDVNSHHHQCLDRVADGLRVVARSEEGIIEAVEHASHPYLMAVQWHPERLGVDRYLHQELFDDFIRAVTEQKIGR